METFYSQRAILADILAKFTEPAKYKIKFYQLAIFMCIETIISLFLSKYVLLRLKLEEKKKTLIEQSQLPSSLISKFDLFNNKNIQKSFMLIKDFKLKVKNGFGKSSFLYFIFFIIIVLTVN